MIGSTIESERRRPGRITMLVACGSLVLAAAPSGAIDRFVSTKGSDVANACTSAASPCRTIVNAVLQAASGDTVKVAGGKYKEQVSITDTTLTLSGGWTPTFASQNVGANRTVLQGRNAAGKKAHPLRVEDFDGGATDVTVHGFEISNGRAIRIFAGNGATIHVTFARSIVNGNVDGSIVNLASGGGSTKPGGGISVHAAGTGAIDLDVIDSLITRNALKGDGPDNQGAGIGIVAQHSSQVTASLVNTVVARNDARRGTGGPNGGGIAASADAAASIALSVTNATIVRNSAQTYPRPSFFAESDGGGIWAVGPVVVDLVSSVVHGNRANRGSDVFVADGATVNLDHDIVAHVDATDGTLNDLGGNLSADPRLDARYHLRTGSPAIDAGTCAGAPSTDFEGDPRPSGATCDIGADELVP